MTQMLQTYDAITVTGKLSPYGNVMKRIQGIGTCRKNSRAHNKTFYIPIQWLEVGKNLVKNE